MMTHSIVEYVIRAYASRALEQLTFGAYITFNWNFLFFPPSFLFHQHHYYSCYLSKLSRIGYGYDIMLMETPPKQCVSIVSHCSSIYNKWLFSFFESYIVRLFKGDRRNPKPRIRHLNLF